MSELEELGDPAAEPLSRSTRVLEAVHRARNRLLSLQTPLGWWKGELQTNVTMDAEDLLLRQFLGIRDEQVTTESARWIRSQQREDGTWATFHDGPGDLSTTAEAYTALKLAGDPADARHMRQARQFVLDSGGLERSRVFTRIWLALFGEWSWNRLPVLPPEMILLPSWCPLNIHDWGCWARQTAVPLTVVSATRPCRDLGVSVRELRSGSPAPQAERLPSWVGAFHHLDRVLHAYERLPAKPLRRLSLRKAEQWILDRQEADGSWGGIQPPWVYSVLALHLLGYSPHHQVLQRALSGLEGFVIRERGDQGWVRRLEACQSPVWDTALALTALLDTGTPPDAPEVLRAVDWLLSQEVRKSGDWTVRRPGLRPSGWAFEFANDTYPDIDDTAEVVLALRRVRHPDPSEVAQAIHRASRWVQGMQCIDGGWAAFDADNTRTLCEKLPFCDFGAVIDPPSADVTAHVLEMLAMLGDTGSAQVRQAVRWLLEHQEPAGSWFGRWGANHVYGIGAVVPALVAAGLPTSHEALRAAVRWLGEHQNPDGGWGEDLRSYRDPDWIGRGESTASQTAWALLALLATGERGQPLLRGVDWLVATQRADGSWDEPQFTGTGFPGDFYINYHLYRLVFPISALARFLEANDAQQP
ncbi:squalene--hopene cyclase [Kutzneria albida]|uniref:Squalene--hopene cyclase n=1 Tax=Kutzneria albida DSM 43870 TaxID=1449976 RepID=W5W8E3_9PSEU|nr:squalene--hopene cyclase [Kutzneria albida]AHH97408.1 hypothetical protein KALB_4044 [Kutzneria albida DSM 43870]